MAHQFTIEAKIQGISLADFTRLATDIKMHETVCQRIPAQNLEILESHLEGDIYTL